MSAVDVQVIHNLDVAQVAEGVDIGDVCRVDAVVSVCILDTGAVQ